MHIHIWTYVKLCKGSLAFLFTMFPLSTTWIEKLLTGAKCLVLFGWLLLTQMNTYPSPDAYRGPLFLTLIQNPRKTPAGWDRLTTPCWRGELFPPLQMETFLPKQKSCSEPTAGLSSSQSKIWSDSASPGASPSRSNKGHNEILRTNDMPPSSQTKSRRCRQPFVGGLPSEKGSLLLFVLRTYDR